MASFDAEYSKLCPGGPAKVGKGVASGIRVSVLAQGGVPPPQIENPKVVGARKNNLQSDGPNFKFRLRVGEAPFWFQDFGGPKRSKSTKSTKPPFPLSARIHRECPHATPKHACNIDVKLWGRLGGEVGDS